MLKNSMEKPLKSFLKKYVNKFGNLKNVWLNMIFGIAKFFIHILQKSF